MLDLDPTRIITQYELARAYAEDGRAEEAKKGFIEVLRLQPDHAAARRELAALES